MYFSISYFVAVLGVGDGFLTFALMNLLSSGQLLSRVRVFATPWTAYMCEIKFWSNAF